MQYYFRDNPKDKSGKYLPKRDEKKISLYLQKKYDEEVIRLVNQEKEYLEKFIFDSKITSETIQNLYSSQPKEIKDMIVPVDMSDDDFALEWLSMPYEKKEIDEEKNTSRTDNGEVVRSKSEKNIANALLKFEIPYKYECPYVLSTGQVIYPDFTVLNKRTRKEIYWEHRGMMDDREYAKSTVIRLKKLEKEGVFLGDNLIITEETSASPLGTDEIELIINHYFL